MSDLPVRWGIVGPGRIAAALVPDFAEVADAELAGVASRSAARAHAFAAQHGIPRAFGSYREIIEDPDIDVLYIATPHPQHCAIGLAALRAGKAILVEKAFTATLAGAEQLVSESRERQVFAMEAMWTRFQPAVIRVAELIADGAIGEVHSVQADLGVMREFDPSDRVFSAELGGGALLDLGVYLVSFAQMILRTPGRTVVSGFLEPSGVDAAASMLLDFSDGRTATLMCDLHSPLPGHARIFGTQGWIDLLPRFHHPDTFVLHRTGSDPKPVTLPALGSGYAHELIEVDRCLRAGQIESAVMPLADTLEVQAVLEDALHQLGVDFAEDEAALAAAI